MKFDASSLQKHQTGHFGFSAVPLDRLGSSIYCLATFVVDCSGSVSGFQKQLEAALKEILKACGLSDYKDTFLVRLVTFNDSHKEIHGFRLLADIKPEEYDNILDAYGYTALNDANVDALEATANFGRQLIAQDYNCNGIVVVFTDGMNNRGKCTMATVKQASQQCIKGESLESLVTILVGVLDKASSDYAVVSQYLSEYKEQAGFSQYVELNDLSEKGFAKLANFVSQSMSSQSQQVNSGGPSQPIDPDF